MEHKDPESNWVMVNLWENYDEELLERFSREMVVPNYKKEELHPLNDWKHALSPEGRKNPFIPDLHVMLAFKKDNRSSLLSSSSSSSQGSPVTSPVSDRLNSPLSPIGSPTWNNLAGSPSETSSLKLKGGIIFEYYSDINCGLFNYLIIKRKHRNRGLDRVLIKKAIDTLDRSAHLQGHLAGINAMFFETKSAQNVSHQQDVLDPRQQHAILHQMGFRLLDFDYVQLPLVRLGKINYLLLTVYLTPHIPKMPLQAAEKYYLPSVLLKNFIHALWENAYAAGRIKNKPDEDPDFRRSMEQIELREKIPLLDLPWGAGKPWTLVDLWEDYDEDLLTRFYRELIVPLQKRDDSELLAKLKMVLSPEGRENAYTPDVHILLAVRWPQQEYRTMQQKPVIDGACVFEYHPENNCGLLTSLLQQRKNRVDGLDVLLVETTLDILNQNAKERGNLAGCNAIFLQAKSSAYSSTYSQDIIDITQHHIVLHKMGFRLLDFEYVAPRGRSDPTRPFVLTVYLTPLIPIMYYEKGDRAYLPNTLIRNFVERQWLNAHGMGQITVRPEQSQDYQRMLEQVELREKIPLLDLPWVGGKPWTLVDLWEDFDEDLLRRFYNELMLPNFPNRCELEPLDNWLRSLSEESREDPNISDVHVLLALKWPVVDSDAKGASGSSGIPGSPAMGSTSLRGSSGVSPSLSLSSSLGIPNPPIIEGGIVFEYYSANNCGLLTYLIVHRNYRGQGLDRVLVESALEILDHNAKDKGYLPGCNAIFLEVSSAEKVTMKQDVVDPRMRHTIYHQIGFRLIDCEYIAPPLSPSFPKLKDLFLTVYLTPHIPKMPLEENKYYLPSSVLKNFMTVLWNNATASGKIKCAPEADQDYIRSIEQIELREKIPLLDLPWGASKPWTLVDLWEDFDEELLQRFYTELMIPNFPLRDELEPLENFVDGLSESRRTIYTQQPELHIILALRWNDGSGIALGGGITFEYYPSTNCGLLTYLIVHRSSRGQGLASVLVERAVHLLQQTARRRGHLAGCNAILLETNSAEKVTVQQDVMDPRMRHTIYHKMGFRLLDFEYIMPPLGTGLEKLKGVLLLTVYLTPHIPWLPLTNGGKYYYLPSVLLKNFISGQWQHAYNAGRTTKPLEDTDFRMSIDQIDLREKIPLLDLPWGDGKDWTVVDLWEDYDEDLLDAFYSKYMTTFGVVEPLENWHKALSTEGRDDPNICDLHVLLPLLLPGEHKGHKGHKYMVGGLVFEYYPITNCALVTYVVVNEKYSNKGIGTDLLRRAITILDQNAKTKGHISGCNAIFLEVKFFPSERESVSHQFLYNKGFRLLDFEYYQPPTSLKNPVSHNVCLTLLLTSRIPRLPDTDRPYIPSTLLSSFLTTLWADECGLIDYQYEHDPQYTRMLHSLDQHDVFSTLDLPWARSRITSTSTPTSTPTV